VILRPGGDAGPFHTCAAERGFLAGGNAGPVGHDQGL
jgi:hypothetical protein